jgi:tetratricopeptide (TPR) repeat protein
MIRLTDDLSCQHHAVANGSRGTNLRVSRICLPSQSEKAAGQGSYTRRTRAMRGAGVLLEGRFRDAEEAAGETMTVERTLNRGAPVASGLQMFGFCCTEGRRDAFERMGQVVRSLVAQNPESRALRCALAYVASELAQTREAHAEFERLAANAFRNIPEDEAWLPCMAELVETCAFLGDAPRAATLAGLLAPYEGRAVIDGAGVTYLGPVSYFLGLLATTRSRWEEASRHFEQALEMNRRMGAWPWLARTRYAFARMLLTRGGAGDHERASTLLAGALDTARALDMPLLVEHAEAAAGRGASSGKAAAQRVLSRRGGAAISPASTSSAATAAAGEVFRREGEIWSLVYADRSVQLRHTKGLSCIAHLLTQPGDEVHVVDLVALDADGSNGEEPAITGGDLGALLDPRARAEYKERLQDLRNELEEAVRAGDLGRAAQARDETERLSDALAAAYGLGGRARTAGDPTERMRKAVTIQIRRSLERIHTVHPTLGRHLANGLRTGIFCSYMPERPITWSL